jgi:hypothetical protein
MQFVSIVLVAVLVVVAVNRCAGERVAAAGM